MALYYQNLRDAEMADRNLALEALARLVQRGGYRDIAHAERVLSGRGD